MKRTANSAFTLVELLLVMGIISGLATLFVATYPSALKRARDTQRKSDIKQYQTSVEVFANNHQGFYPSEDVIVPVVNVLCTDIGLSECPADPKNGINSCSGNTCGYFFQSNGSGPGNNDATQYIIWGALEQPSSGNPAVFVVCSNGISGEVSAGIPPAIPGGCPI